MAFYGAQQQQQSTVPYQQVQHFSMPVMWANQYTMAQTSQPMNNMMMARGFTTPNPLGQVVNAPSRQVLAPRVTAPDNNSRTLELQAIAKDMSPRSLPTPNPSRSSLHSSLNQRFVILPSHDAALLQLVEVFCFSHRLKLPYEPIVMPNATLYYDRLVAVKSPMIERMEEVVGFRCCGCRHTTLMSNGYIVGAAHLVQSQYFSAKTLHKTLVALKMHIVQCEYVSAPIKNKLVSNPGRGSTESSFLMEDYLAWWAQGLMLHAQRKGHPKFKFNPPMVVGTTTVTTIQNAASGHKGVDPSVTQLQQALGSFQKRPPSFYNSNAPQSPVPPLVDDEDVVRWDLEDSVLFGLVGNNFGVPRTKPRMLAAKLSELTLENQDRVLPLLELLLQSVCAIQRWGSSSSLAGTKRSHQDTVEPSSNPRPSHVFLECIYCQGNAFNASTATARDAADFIFSAACQHLCQDCSPAPVDLQENLSKMRKRLTAEQRYQQRTILEEGFKSWQAQFLGGPKGLANRLVGQPKFWRPLTWRFIEENGGAMLADATLAHPEGSVFLEDDSKKFPWPTPPPVIAEPISVLEGLGSAPAAAAPRVPGQDDDVLVGWTGKHVGNRRFLQVLSMARPAFRTEGLTSLQNSIIACEVLRVILDRGGYFYAVGSNELLPPKSMPNNKVVDLIVQVLKRGNFVLYQKPTDPLKTGRSSCVLECEIAPQRSLFGKDIVRNKRFKKSAPMERV